MEIEQAQVIDYGSPKLRRGGGSTFGCASLWLGILSFAAALLIVLGGDSLATIVLMVVYLASSLAGLVCGIIGISRRSRRRGEAIAGIVIHGLFLGLAIEISLNPPVC